VSHLINNEYFPKFVYVNQLSKNKWFGWAQADYIQSLIANKIHLLAEERVKESGGLLSKKHI